MTKRWGAQREDWKKLIKLGLTDDLLPVVSKPGATIAPESTMKTIGKTPSRYNDRGQVVGIGQWTARTAHRKEVDAWAEEPDYGICLQTRQVRALDIDVEDQDKADGIAQFVEDWLDCHLPRRGRKGSGKCLLAFRLPGNHAKRTVKTEGGMIEFLANGQQFIAAGTHPSGARYEWTWPTGDDFPTITEDEFENLWFALCEEFGTEAPTERRSATRDYQYKGEVSDETGKFLVDNGHAIGQGRDGQIFIECPFSNGHSTEDNGTSTAYFPAGSGGYERGHFVCLHASCAKRHDDEFLDAYGLRDKDFEPIALTPAEEAQEPPRFAVDKHGQPKATLYNLKMALERPDICGYRPKYDQFRDEIIFYDKNGKWHGETDEMFVEIRMRLESVHQFLPIGREIIRDAVLWVAKKAKVDTAIEWLNAQEWDGVERIEKFLPDYMGVEDNDYTRACSLYLWTGFAGRVLDPGLKADMIVVLKSPEGYKKSSAIEAIAPTVDQFVEIDFSEKDADLARKMRGALVAEIAELRGLRTRELEGILAFVSRRFEKWIPKFREFSTSFPRRLMFIGTTNEDEFLDGVREHRRWLPMTVLPRGADTLAVARDRKQLWAEARDRFKKDGLLFQEAERLGKLYREEYRIKDAWEDVIAEWLATPDDLTGKAPRDEDFVRVPDVARFGLCIDPKNLKRQDEMKIASAMKSLGYESRRTWDKMTEKQIRAWVKVETQLPIA